MNLSVWHAEAVWRNVFLGEVEVSLGLWDWTYTQPLWQDLQPRVGGIKDAVGYWPVCVCACLASAGGEDELQRLG